MIIYPRNHTNVRTSQIHISGNSGDHFLGDFHVGNIYLHDNSTMFNNSETVM